MGGAQPGWDTPADEIRHCVQAVHAAAPFPAAPVATELADEAFFANLLARVGATLTARDDVDDRVLRQVRDGTGKIIDSQKDVGGWPALAAGTAPLDTDGDGMPDAWETRQGLDPKNGADARKSCKRPVILSSKLI